MSIVIAYSQVMFILQVFGSRRFDSRTICVCYPQEDQSEPGESHFHVCQERAASHR